MDIQRLRNLTTGKLHTKIEDIYEDIEFLTGEKGIMTHQIPDAFEALQPLLRLRVTEERFWDGAFDVTHTGDYQVDPMTEEEQTAFWDRYGAVKQVKAFQQKVAQGDNGS